MEELEKEQFNKQIKKLLRTNIKRKPGNKLEKLPIEV